MTKIEKIFIVYLLIIPTASVILNLVILNKKTLPLPKPIMVQAEKTTSSPLPSTETNLSTNSAGLIGELTAIHNELSQIRAIQREQSQTLGTTDSDIEDLLEDINVPMPQTTPTGQISPDLGQITLKTSTSADIHQEKSSSSAVIGHIYFGGNYPYLQKQGNWYLIKTEVLQGWVNASLVKEIN